MWTDEIDVAVTTLDELIGQHGTPRFIKLDIEGFEHEALLGLSRAAPVLSFEFTTIQKDVALACLERLSQLGYASFHASLGETLAFTQEGPLSAAETAAWITALPPAANSGDIYASLEG